MPVFTPIVQTGTDTHQKYSILLKKVRDEHELADRPGQIYNCDNTGMLFDAHSLSVVMPTKEKEVCSRTFNSKPKQRSSLVLVLLAKQYIPTMVTFDLKNLQYQLTKCDLPGTF